MDAFEKLLEEKIIEYENKTYEWQVNHMNCHDYAYYLEAQRYKNIHKILVSLWKALYDR